jgi:hypothetical protein
MSYLQRDDTLVLTDISVAAARSNINRNDLITKIRVLAKAWEVKKRKENVDRAKANKAKFIPLVFEARGGLGEADIKFFKSATRANRTFERSSPGSTTHTSNTTRRQSVLHWPEAQL